MQSLQKVAAITLLFSTTAVNAGTYQALCAGTKCTVNLSPTSITSPFGTIPTNRVTNWGGGGDSSTAVGTGIATTVLLGPIGLLGFLAKKHDYNFLVNGYDKSGKEISLQIQFRNDKPAKRFINEMNMLTKLGMGQTRTASEIMQAESASSTGISAGTLEGDAALEGGAVLEGGNTSILGATKKSSQNCWTTYLENNPAMSQWAEANPAMAESNKKKFDDC